MDESNNPNFNGNNNMPNPGQDPYASMNPDFDNSQYNTFDPSSIANSNINDFDDNQVVNPILNVNLQNNSNNDAPDISSDFMQNSYTQNDMNYQDNSYADSNMGYQDNSYAEQNMNYQDNSYTDPNMNYQDSYTNSNTNYQDSNYNNSTMNYQNNDYTNSNYQDSYNNSNMGYQDNSYAGSNMGYQDNNYADSNMGYQDNNFVDPNMNYQTNDAQYPNQNYNVDPNNGSGDYNADFVKAWMGNLYDKAHKNKFNWCAAIFQEVYLLHRKMYLTGILFLVLKYLIVFLSVFLLTKIGLASLALAGVACVLFVFIFGFGFYPLYRNFVKNKLNKFKQTTTDNSQLINMATQKGGQSTIAVVLYCVGIPILLSIVCGILMTLGIFNFDLDFLNNTDNTTDQDIDNVIDEEEVYDYQKLEFTEGYAIEYDSLLWFLDETDNSLTKGNYKLTYSGQSLVNIKETFGFDMSTAAGRSSLLDSLIASFESQAAALNVSVQKGSSNFIAGTSLPNVYYSYVDVESAESLSRNYLILLPEDDILFQFILTIDDTSIDSMTSAEVVSILTSVAPFDETETENNNENIIDVNIVNEIGDSNVVDEGQNVVNGLDENVVDGNAVSNETTNDTTPTANDTVPTENTTDTNSVTNSTLGEFLR